MWGLPEFFYGAGIGSWEFFNEPGRHQDSGSCEALRFNLMDMATLESSEAGDEIGIFWLDWADLIYDSALRFLNDGGEIICR